MHKWSTSCPGGRSKINNLLVSFINLNVITCNMKKKKKKKEKRSDKTISFTLICDDSLLAFTIQPSVKYITQ